MVAFRALRPLLLTERLPAAMGVFVDRYRDDERLEPFAADLEREVDVGVPIPLELLRQQPFGEQPSLRGDEVSLQGVDLWTGRWLPLSHRLAHEPEGSSQTDGSVCKRLAERGQDVAGRLDREVDEHHDLAARALQPRVARSRPANLTVEM